MTVICVTMICLNSGKHVAKYVTFYICNTVFPTILFVWIHVVCNIIIHVTVFYTKNSFVLNSGEHVVMCNVCNVVIYVTIVFTNKWFVWSQVGNKLITLFEKLWTGKPVLQKCYICNIVIYVKVLYTKTWFLNLDKQLLQ